jgi:hypothetical protein
VAGLSAAHTVYLNGGNVAVLDKQGTMVYQLNTAVFMRFNPSRLPSLPRISQPLGPNLSEFGC